MFKMKKLFLLFTVVSICLLGLFGLTHITKSENTSNANEQTEEEFLDISKDNVEEENEEKFEEEFLVEEDVEYDYSSDLNVETYASGSINVSTFANFKTYCENTTYATINVTASFTATSYVTVNGKTINMNGYTLNMGTYVLRCVGSTTIKGGTITGSKAAEYYTANGVIQLGDARTHALTLSSMTVKATGTGAAVYCGIGCSCYNCTLFAADYPISIANSTICNTGAGPAIYAGGSMQYNLRINNSQVYTTNSGEYSVLNPATTGSEVGKYKHRRAYAVFSTFASIIVEGGSRIYNSDNKNWCPLIESYYGSVTIGSTSRVEGALVPGQGTVNIYGYVGAINDCKFHKNSIADNTNIVKLNITGSLDDFRTEAGVRYKINIGGEALFSMRSWGNFDFSNAMTTSCFDLTISDSASVYLPNYPLNYLTPCNIKINNGTIHGNIKLASGSTFTMMGGKLNGGIMAWNSTIDISGGTIECSKSPSSGYYDKCLRLHVTNDMATCTITDGTFIDTYGKQVISSEGNGDLYIQGGTFKTTSTADTHNLITVSGTTSCTISDGTFINNRSGHAAVAVKGSAALNVSGGSFEGEGKAISIESASTVSINGGDFATHYGIGIRNDSTNLPINISNISINSFGKEGIKTYSDDILGANVPRKDLTINIDNVIIEERINSIVGNNSTSESIFNITNSVMDYIYNQSDMKYYIGENSQVNEVKTNGSYGINVTLDNCEVVGGISSTSREGDIPPQNNILLKNNIKISNLHYSDITLLANTNLNMLDSTVNLWGTTTLNPQGYTFNGLTSNFDIKGSLTVSGSGTIKSKCGSGTLVNHGTLIIDSSNITISSYGVNDGGAAIANYGTLNFYSGKITSDVEQSINNYSGTTSIVGGTINGIIHLEGSSNLYLSGTPTISDNIYLSSTTAKLYGRNLGNTSAKYTGSKIGVECNLDAFTSKKTAVYDGTSTYFNCVNPGYSFVANGSNLDIDLNAATVTKSSGINKTYNGSASNISVTPSHTLSVNYTYQWYNSSGTAISGATTNTLSRTNVADSGTYYCIVTAKQNSFSKSTHSGNIVVSITRAAGKVTLSPTSGSVVYGTASKTFTATTNSGTLSVTADNTTATVGINNGTVTISTLSALNAGTTIKVTVSAAQSPNYTAASAVYTLTITKANISPSVTMTGYTYAGTKTNPSVSGNTGKGTVTYYYSTSNTNTGGTAWSKVTSSTTLNVGTYYMYAVVDETTNYYGETTSAISFEITKADITGIEFSGSTITYDKDTHSLKITGTLPQNVSVSYTLNGTTFSGASNVGSYNVKAEFTNNNNNYNDLAPMSATLTIQPKDVTVEFKDYENLVYNKNEQEITVNLKGVIDGDNCTIKTMTGNKGKNAGDYTCEVTALSNSNYALSGTTSLGWSIAKYQVEKPKEDTTVYTYTGENQTYQVEASEFYTVTNQTQKDAGAYTVIITLNDTANYEWKDKSIEKLEYSFTIRQKAVDIIWSNNTFTYNGEEQDKSGIIAYYLTLPSSTKNYLTVRCNSESFKLANTYTFSVELDDTKNYTVANSSDSHSYTIEKASITLQAEDKSSAYGASLEALTYTVVSGTNYNDEITPVLTTTATATSNVDTYPITITATNDNYDITLTNGTYTITSKAIEVSIEDQIAGYTGEEPVVDQTAYTTEETGDLEIVISKEAGVVVGEYKLTATSTNTNYDITFVYTNGDHSIYTIEKASFTYTVENYSGTYDKESHSGAVKITDLSDSEYTIYYSTAGKLTEENYSSSSTKNPSFTDAGKTTVYFYIVAHDYENRGGSFTVEITKKEVTVTFSGYEGLVYDSTEKTITATLVGVIEGDTCTITGITGDKNTNAESYTCEVTEISNPNYVLSGTTTQGYTIEKAKITFTAEDKNSTYGAALKELTYTVSGTNFNNEITPVVTTTATTTSNVGTYPITITASNDNYDITLNDGTYSITKATVSGIAFTDKEVDYNGEIQTIEITGELPEEISVEYHYNSEVFSGKKDAGSYLVEASFTVGDNYNEIAPMTATLLIQPKAIEVSILDQSSSYTGEEPEIDQTAYTTEETEDLGIVITKEAGVVVGDYKLTATSSNTNYDITFVYTNGDHSIYTIEKEALKVTTENYSGTYDKESHSGAVNVADVDSSTYTIYYSTTEELTESNYSTASTTNPSFTDAGTTTVYYYIVAHDYKNCGGSFTVEIMKKEVTVTFSGYEGLVYDSTEKTITATLNGVIEGDTCTITGITGDKNTNAESYTCEVTEISNPNYVLSGKTTQGYTIEKAKITFTAEDKTSTYGASLEALTYVESGTNYDEITPVVTTTATTTSNVGTYPITITATNDNYDITLNDGTYTITKATPTITTKPTASSIYLGQTLANSVLTELQASVEGTFNWVNPNIMPGLGENNYEVIFTPEDTTNYEEVILEVSMTTEKLFNDEEDSIKIDKDNYEELKEIVDNYNSLTEEEKNALDPEVRAEIQRLEQALKKYHTPNELPKTLIESIGVPCSLALVAGAAIQMRRKKKGITNQDDNDEDEDD